VAAPTSNEVSEPEDGAPSRDGFYLRAATGYGWLGSPEGEESFGKLSGFGPALDLAVGGALTPGLALGGAISSTLAASPKHGDTATADWATVLQALAVLDFYPKSDFGLHFMGGLGLAYSVVGATPDYYFFVDKETGLGVGALAAVGYDFAVSKSVNLGVLARLQFATTSFRDVPLYAPALMFSFSTF
jgi:hypothetical protein